MKQPKIRLTIIIMVLLVLCQGCSFFYFPVFRNLSSEPVTITFMNVENLEPFNYSNSILPINKKIWKQTNQSLAVERDENAKLLIKIPAHSTVIFPRDITRAGKIMILQQGSRIDTLNMDVIDSIPTFKCVRRGFPVAYICYYDYNTR